MTDFLAAAAVLLACVPLTLLIGAVVLRLSGENWASWSAAPTGWGLAGWVGRSGLRLRGPDRRTAQSRLRPMPEAEQRSAGERRRGSDRRQDLGAT